MVRVDGVADFVGQHAVGVGVRSGKGARGRNGEYGGSGDHECEALQHHPAPWLISGLRVLWFVDAVDGGRGVLELLGGLAEAPGQLRQLGCAEQEHDDREDDDEFSGSETHGKTFRPLKRPVRRRA